jgi:DNA invertase Pin-like site-specific DNA recombinase
MKVALYIRRSTDEVLQKFSLEVQEDLLRAYATSRGHDVVDVYLDSASGRNVDKRTGFQSLIRAVAEGAHFQAVLVRDVSRWGRFQDLDESAYWEFFCRYHGVDVVYAEEEFSRDESSPYLSLQKALKRFTAAEHSREKARLVQFGHYRSVRAGNKLGGIPPHGYDRALFDSDGNILQRLQPGERKLLSTHSVKLVPGDPAKVAAVRLIFDLFVKSHVNVSAIATELNARGFIAPRGGPWTAGTLERILINPVYIGRAHAIFRQSPNFAEPTEVISDPSWEPLIDVETWSSAQKEITVRRQWLAAIRTKAPEAREPSTVYRTYFNLFRDVPAVSDFQTLIENEWMRVQSTLRASMARVDVTPSFIVLNNTLRVGVKASFPHLSRQKSITWEFVFDGSEDFDVTVAIGLTPPPFVHADQYFVLWNKRFLKKSCVRRLSLWGGRRRKSYCDGLPAVALSLRWFSEQTSVLAEEAFLSAISELSLVNTADIDRKLGWTEGRAYTMYKILLRRGLKLPPLKKKLGRRISLVCEGCGTIRTMPVSNAMQFDSTLCRACFNAKRRRYRICPDCGDCRRQGPGEYSTWCRRCAPKHFLPPPRKRSAKTGRFLRDGEPSDAIERDEAFEGRRLNARDEARALRMAKVELLLAVARRVREIIRDRKDAFRETYVTDRCSRCLPPTVSWRDPNNGRRYSLTVDCSDSWTFRNAGKLTASNVGKQASRALRREWEEVKTSRRGVVRYRVLLT